jgi:hypothetical protein
MSLATNTRDKPSQIFAQVVSQCDDNVHALLPREENSKRTIRYQRPTPPVPAIYADVRLPEEYTTTTNNQQFLQYDNGQNAENRMLVFYSPDSLERLANANLGKDLAGFVSGVGCQVFHGISCF